MTCIVGYVEKQKVIIGGDSAGVAGLSISHRIDKKVFKNGPFIMGFTSSFRMGQLLMSSYFVPPKQKPDQSDYDFMVTTFIDAVKKCFKKGGYSQTYSSGDDKGGTFLVGYKGKLYMIEDDFQVAEDHKNYYSVGCGEDLAHGALFAMENSPMSGVDKVKKALEAASYFSGGVEPPFNIVEMDFEESSKASQEIKEITKKKKGKKK